VDLEEVVDVGPGVVVARAVVVVAALAGAVVEDAGGTSVVEA
jgi:hypothetical protein